mgnify:CR=1 FL=1|jgi:plasmid stabilization system protein ParE
MGILNIVIRKRALNTIERVTEWYESELGHKAAQHFVDDVYNTISTLSHSPHIGIFSEDYSTEKKQYYSFLLHPKYRIIYRFTNKTLYIVAVRATMKKYK